MKKIRQFAAYAVIDCQWNTMRELYIHRKDAIKAKQCKKCRIIKLKEVL